MKRVKKSQSAITQVQAVLVIVVILVAGGAAAYFATLPTAPPTTTTTSTTTTTTTTTTTVPPLRVKETLVMGTTDDVGTTLDPAEAYDLFGVNLLYNVGRGLTRFEEVSGRVVPDLATTWTVSADGKVYTLELRQDAKFHDGTPLTADAVKFSWDRVATLALDPSFLLTEVVQSVEVTGQYQVKVTLKDSFAHFLAIAATWIANIVNPNTTPVELVTPVGIPDSIGPYKLTSWVLNERWKLEADPNFYGDAPKTPTFIIQRFKDGASLRLAVERGDIDIAFRTLAPADIRDLSAKGLLGQTDLKVITGSGIAPIRYMIFDVEKPPFDNKLVRQAIAAAVDRKRIVETSYLGELAQPLYSQVPIGMFGHTEAFKDKYGEGPNLELAVQLLRQAGYSEENKLNIEIQFTVVRYTPVEPDNVAVIWENLQATGLINVELRGFEWTSYQAARRANQLSLSMWGWFPDFVDPDNYVRPFFDSEGQAWTRGSYNNPDMDRLIDLQILQTDPVAREQTLAQILALSAEDVAILPLWQEAQYAVVKPEVRANSVILDASNIFRIWLIFAEVRA